MPYYNLNQHHHQHNKQYHNLNQHHLNMLFVFTTLQVLLSIDMFCHHKPKKIKKKKTSYKQVNYQSSKYCFTFIVEIETFKPQELIIKILWNFHRNYNMSAKLSFFFLWFFVSVFIVCLSWLPLVVPSWIVFIKIDKTKTKNETPLTLIYSKV